VDELIRAVPEIRKTSPGVRCRIVGDGSDRSRLEALAKELSVADRVSFLGSLGEADLRREYASCDLFVMPSSREGFGIVFLEAASYGKASIGAAAGGTPEVIRDGATGLLVPPGDPAALAAAIASLLGNVGRLRALGEAARADLHERFVFPSFRKRFADLVLPKVGPGGMNG
jgi:glycosyltransferase involved in cell wall biosynthesis